MRLLPGIGIERRARFVIAMVVIGTIHAE